MEEKNHQTWVYDGFTMFHLLDMHGELAPPKKGTQDFGHGDATSRKMASSSSVTGATIKMWVTAFQPWRILTVQKKMVWHGSHDTPSYIPYDPISYPIDVSIFIYRRNQPDPSWVKHGEVFRSNSPDPNVFFHMDWSSYVDIHGLHLGFFLVSFFFWTCCCPMF